MATCWNRPRASLAHEAFLIVCLIHVHVCGTVIRFCSHRDLTLHSSKKKVRRE